MGVESGDGSGQGPEDGIGSGAAEVPPGLTDDAGACVVRRIVINPGRGLIIDVPRSTITTLIGASGEALGAGHAGASMLMDMGRKMVGGEAPGPPQDVGGAGERAEL